MGLIDSEELNLHTKFEVIQLTMDKIQKTSVFATPRRKTWIGQFSHFQKKRQNQLICMKE